MWCLAVLNVYGLRMAKERLMHYSYDRDSERKVGTT
jgi:hypothetical protein